VVFLVFIRSIRLVGMEKTEGAPSVAAESKLKGHMRHMCAYLATGDERTGADGLAGIMNAQDRDTLPKTRYLGCHFRFVVIEIHALHQSQNGCLHSIHPWRSRIIKQYITNGSAGNPFQAVLRNPSRVAA
jgi:hypothetical protein